MSIKIGAYSISRRSVFKWHVWHRVMPLHTSHLISGNWENGKMWCASGRTGITPQSMHVCSSLASTNERHIFWCPDWRIGAGVRLFWHDLEQNTCLNRSLPFSTSICSPQPPHFIGTLCLRVMLMSAALHLNEQQLLAAAPDLGISNEAEHITHLRLIRSLGRPVVPHFLHLSDRLPLRFPQSLQVVLFKNWVRISFRTQARHRLLFLFLLLPHLGQVIEIMDLLCSCFAIHGRHLLARLCFGVPQSGQGVLGRIYLCSAKRSPQVFASVRAVAGVLALARPASHFSSLLPEKSKFGK